MTSSGAGGGGILNGGILTLNDSTVTDNSCTVNSGGGIFNAGIHTLNHSTVFGNVSGGPGGGVYNNDGSTLSINYSVVAGNTAPTDSNLSGTLTSGSDNLFDIDPKLAPLGNYGGRTPTMPPLPHSPLVDAGVDSGSLPATDQRGFARVVGGAVDIGAVETGHLIPGIDHTVVTSIDDSFGDIDSGAVSLKSSRCEPNGSIVQMVAEINKRLISH